MKRLGVYWIRLQKNKSSKPPRSRSLRWAVTEGDGDGHSICLRTLINQTIGLSADTRRIRAKISNFQVIFSFSDHSSTFPVESKHKISVLMPKTMPDLNNFLTATKPL